MPTISRMDSCRKRRGYKKYIKKPQYASGVDKMVQQIQRKRQGQQGLAAEYKREIGHIARTSVVQEMKQFNHHSHTNCFEHSVHVSYYNYLICRWLGWDKYAAAKAGLLHDLFLYDWHGHRPEKGERMHGFEHPTKALKNAHANFVLTQKEGDIILKHMFPLTITPPRYKESCVIILTDKFCSTCEVLDRFFKSSKRNTFH